MTSVRSRAFLALLLAASVLIVLGTTSGVGHAADPIFTAPVGEGTTGAASVAAAPHAGGGGGGGGTGSQPGAGIYFETANLTRGLPWGDVPASQWAAWDKDVLKPGGAASLANGASAQSVERKLVQASCNDKASTKGNCFLWFNDCPQGTAQLHKRPFDGAADRGQIACHTNDWLDEAQEFHTFSPAGGTGATDELSQWDVEVWRQGDSQPVFERRIALGPKGQLLADADPAGTSSAAWWTSGGSFAGSTDSAYGGPLGAWQSASDPSFRGCNDRYASAPRVVVGTLSVDGNPTQLAYTNSAVDGAKAPTVGGDTFNCFWGGWSNGGRGWLPGMSSRETAPCPTCFYEGISLSWQVPDAGRYASGGVVKAKFSYRILGKPNTFYAIRIVSLDHREQLLMANTFRPSDHLYYSQYFHVLIPTAISGFDFATPTCTCPAPQHP